MLEYLTQHYVLLFGGVFLGLGVGTLTGLFGAGGGFIITPALNIFLGVEMNLAVGTSACQVLGASAFSLRNHLDRRLLGIRVALFIGLGIPLGSYAGAKLVKYLKGCAQWTVGGRVFDPVNLVLMGVFSVFLLLIAGWMLYDSFVLSRHKHDDSGHVGALQCLRIPPLFRFRTIPAGEFSIPVMVALGLGMGFMSGLLGIGGGVIMLPVLYYLVGQETRAATYSNTMLILVSGVFSTFFHAMDGNINYPLAGALVCGAFGGAKIGAYLQHRLDAKSLRRYFAFVVLAAWALVVWKLAAMWLSASGA